MTEAELQTAIVQLAKQLGYISYHTRDSRRSDRGFPDLVLVHPISGRLIYAELKSETGKLRPEQQTWMQALGIRHDAFVWRPQHLQSGAITDVLQQGRVAA